ncbi:DinB family protein [Peribacillus kribbensis]|uniref:DinB family protein n=1 Tax=Peribacillus kribbensis TaxID=356658 RepID=UPI000402D2BD|nr:DinB family protein [Peribacillus kribbensis]
MEEILNDYVKITAFFERLKDVSDEWFFSPLAEGKWSAAAIVSHFRFWDRYILEERLPLMLKGEDLPKSNINVDEVNAKAQEYAHSGVTKRELLDEAINWRERSCAALAGVEFSTSFRIGEKELTLLQFIEGDIEHDEHHMKQIEEFLKKHQAELI